MPDSEKFVAALYSANLLDGRQNENTNLEKAYELLSQVSESSPDNSAPLLYLFHLDAILNDGVNQTSLAKKISQTSYFNSYILDINNALHSLIQRPEDFIEIIDISSELPIPNYSILEKVILQLDSDLVPLQLTEEGLSEESNTEFIDWMGIEYAIGQKLLFKHFNHSEYPSFQELIQQKMELQKNDNHYKVIDRALNTNCNLKALKSVTDDILDGY